MRNADQLRQAVATATGCTVEELLSPIRTQARANSRFVLAILAKQTNPWCSNGEIAKIMGKTDPGTGRHALIRAAHLMETDPEFRAAMERAKNNCEFS